MKKEKNKIAVAGGKARWAKVPKKERSKIMSIVARGLKINKRKVEKLIKKIHE